MKNLCPTDGRVRILLLAHVPCPGSLVDRRAARFAKPISILASWGTPAAQ
jgi:hypothetical protein